MELIMSSLCQFLERVKSTNYSSPLANASTLKAHTFVYLTSFLALFYLHSFLFSLFHFLIHLFKKLKPVINIMGYKNVYLVWKKLVGSKGYKTKYKVPPNTALEHKERNNTIWLLRSKQPSRQKPSKHTIINRRVKCSDRENVLWIHTGRASNSDWRALWDTSGRTIQSPEGKEV